MEIILYSTGCPKCEILKKKLDEKNISYKVVSDVYQMLRMGFSETPMLEVNSTRMDFSAAIQWVKDR